MTLLTVSRQDDGSVKFHLSSILEQDLFFVSSVLASLASRRDGPLRDWIRLCLAPNSRVVTSVTITRDVSAHGYYLCSALPEKPVVIHSSRRDDEKKDMTARLQPSSASSPPSLAVAPRQPATSLLGSAPSQRRWMRSRTGLYKVKGSDVVNLLNGATHSDTNNTDKKDEADAT